MEIKCAIVVHTLGCKLNQAESESLARELAARGYSITAGNKADAFVINTCSVTHMADRKARHLVRSLRTLNPMARIVVTGCYAERDRDALLSCGADIAVDNRDRLLIPDLLEAEWQGKSKAGSGADPLNKADRVRSFIKIQDGCRNFCSYCIVPLVRDRVYCVSADTVLTEIRARVRHGYREAVLTGTEIGSYDYEGLGLRGLIALILKETAIERLRLSSLQPQHISRELIDLWQNNRMCRHFHIALQSGSGTVLRRMNRGYDASLFKRAVEEIRSSLPDASITTDIMVGFPGESDEEFAGSYEFCRLTEFAAMHVFPIQRGPAQPPLNCQAK